MIGHCYVPMLTWVLCWQNPASLDGFVIGRDAIHCLKLLNYLKQILTKMLSDFFNVNYFMTTDEYCYVKCS